MKEGITLEACVSTAAQAYRAEKKGAHQVELCSHLLVGGLTPPEALVRATMRRLTIPIKVMVRPRAGHFMYTPQELALMRASIRRFKQMGVEEVVFGVLDESHQIDLRQTQALAQCACPMRVTFHKAIDELKDPVVGAKALMQVKGVTAILTSGGADTALQGCDTLRKMIATTAHHSLHIISAGKITDKNLVEVHRQIGGSHYHGKRIVGAMES